MRTVMNGIFCTAEKRLEDYFDSITIRSVLGQIRAC
jgi:hypothetical protein